MFEPIWKKMEQVISGEQAPVYALRINEHARWVAFGVWLGRGSWPFPPFPLPEKTVVMEDAIYENQSRSCA